METSLEQRRSRTARPSGRWSSGPAGNYCLRQESTGKGFVDPMRPDREDDSVLNPMHSAIIKPRSARYCGSPDVACFTYRRIAHQVLLPTFEAHSARLCVELQPGR